MTLYRHIIYAAFSAMTFTIDIVRIGISRRFAIALCVSICKIPHYVDVRFDAVLFNTSTAVSVKALCF